jgi:hypothetical protein
MRVFVPSTPITQAEPFQAILVIAAPTVVIEPSVQPLEPFTTVVYHTAPFAPFKPVATHAAPFHTTLVHDVGTLGDVVAAVHPIKPDGSVV